MFPQVILWLAHQHIKRFFYNDGSSHDGTPSEYVQTRLGMGDKHSPLVATETIRRCADMCKKSYPRVYDVIHNQSWMDDLHLGADTVEELDTLIEETIEVLKMGSFSLKGYQKSGEKQYL